MSDQRPDRPPLPTHQLALSFSRLSTYSRCGEQYRLRYIEKVPRLPSGAAIAGTATHKVVEEMATDRWFQDPGAVESHGAKRFVEVFDELLAAEGGPDAVKWGGRKRILRDETTNKPVLDESGEPVKVGENYPWMLKMGPTWVKRAGAILRSDVEQGMSIAEEGIEVEVRAWLDEEGGVLITGYIDAMLLVDADQRLRIRDWKTGSWLDHMQLVNYGWLWNRSHPGANVSVGEFAYLRGAKPEDRLKVYELAPLYPAIEKMFSDAVQGMTGEHYQLHPTSFCGSCAVAPACVYGRTLETAS